MRKKGVISAGHELTARAGCEMLERGGNAFDAALASCFASFVCESVLTSPGGGGFFLARTKEGKTLLFDFFSTVPGKGRAGGGEIDFSPVYIEFAGAVQELYTGKGSSAVPGCMAGLSSIHTALCTLPLHVIMKPAVDYARYGVSVNTQQAYFIDLLSPILTMSPESSNIYAPAGRIVRQGDRIYNKNLADTLEYLSKEGLMRFYEGDMKRRILDGFSTGGLITERDLDEYRVEMREPLEVHYRKRKIYTNPPPSSGGILIALALRLLEPFDLKGLGCNTTGYIKLLAEVMRVTDEARVDALNPVLYEPRACDEFLREERIERYRERIMDGYKGGFSFESLPGNTTHISVLDEDGNAVGVTTSIGTGCGYMIPGTGIMMNNILGEEDLNPFGFHSQPPGMRLSSMMAPIMVVKDDAPEIVAGSGGSKRIRSAILQVLLNIIDHGMSVADAVESPRMHWDGEVIQAEPDIVVEGMNVNLWKEKNMYFGGVNTVVREDMGRLNGSGDGRRGGVCMVVE